MPGSVLPRSGPDGPTCPGHRPAPWPRLEDLDAARRPDRRGGVQGRSARGMVQQPQPTAGQLNPVQPSGGMDPNLKVLGEPGARAAASQSLESTSGLALGGLVATEKA